MSPERIQNDGTTCMSRRRAMQLMQSSALFTGIPMMTARDAKKRRSERPKSLVVLWMNGGMSQLETWDPHPGTESGGEVGDIATSAGGIRISELLPQMAEEMHSCMLIRSLTSKEGDHERGAAFVRTGYRMEPTLKYPTLGAIVAHELPEKDPGIPGYISLSPALRMAEGGYLGGEWNAFKVFNPGKRPSNLENHVAEHRVAGRMRGLQVVRDTFGRNRSTAFEETRYTQTLEGALRMMNCEQLNAFEIERESASVQASYGSTPFGRGCLVARRLIESGVRSVEIHLSGFDTHAANHDGHVALCGTLDPAAAALIRELRDRDLLESTIVLCISEFGRTPGINQAGGRDHWPNWFSCMIAGGGFRSGVVWGETPGAILTSKTPQPGSPVSIPQLMATIMKSMGIDSARELLTPVGRPMQLAGGKPIDELLMSGG